MKHCPKCGAEAADSANFCLECGSPLSNPEPVVAEPVIETPEAETLEYTYTPVEAAPAKNENFNYEYNTNSQAKGEQASRVHISTPGIAPRNIAVAIVLSLVTCGIYGIYWMIKMNDEINTLAGESNATSGVMVFVLTLVTCGIYSFFWIFKMGERCDRIKGTEGGNSNILYLVISLLGFGIVVYCLMQDTINKAL